VPSTKAVLIGGTTRSNFVLICKCIAVVPARIAADPHRDQVKALEKAKQEVWAPRIPTTWGQSKAWASIYQQTFIDIYSKIAFAKLYDRKNSLVAADLLNYYTSCKKKKFRCYEC
jgi:hypothetical protein